MIVILLLLFHGPNKSRITIKNPTIIQASDYYTREEEKKETKRTRRKKEKNRRRRRNRERKQIIREEAKQQKKKANDKRKDKTTTRGSPNCEGSNQLLGFFQILGFQPATRVPILIKEAV